MAATERLGWESRPWGGFLTVYSDSATTVKILRLNPRSAISLQRHSLRDEYWTLRTNADGLVQFQINGVLLTPEPDVRYYVPRRANHRIINDSSVDVEILEVITGYYREDDIIRLDDRYGR